MLAVAAVLAAWTAPRAASAQAAAPDQAADYELVRKIDTHRAWELFLQTHPSGPLADLARKRLSEMASAPSPGRKTEPNWGDQIFIPKLMEKQRH